MSDEGRETEAIIHFDGEKYFPIAVLTRNIFRGYDLTDVDDAWLVILCLDIGEKVLEYVGENLPIFLAEVMSAHGIPTLQEVRERQIEEI